MTYKEAKERVRELRNVTLRKKYKYGEYRVNIKNGGEDTAYYTDDIYDAVDTAVAMSISEAVRKM